MVSACEILSLLAAHLHVPRLSLNTDDACAVRLADGRDLDIQVSDNRDTLWLTLPLGSPEPARRDALLAEALLSNTVLATTSSRHLAWEQQTQRLVFCITLRFDEVLAAGFEQAIQNYLVTGQDLRKEMQRAGVLRT